MHKLYRLFFLFVIGSLFSLSACSNINFKPLYGDNFNDNNQNSGSVKILLSEIYIEQAKNRKNQLVRNQLLHNFNSSSVDINSKYTLKLNSSIQYGNYFSRNYNTLKRLLASGTSNFQLFEKIPDNDKPKLLFTGTETAQATYHNTDNSFNNATAKKDAENRVAIELANNITSAISSYFYKETK